MPSLWLIIAILVWCVLHSLFASLRIKTFARCLAGPGVERVYRLGYNLFAGLSLALLLVPAALLPDRNLYRVASPWSLVMLAGQFLAGLLLLVGFAQSQPLEFLGLRQLGSPVQSQGRLIILGLYRYVRHPLYSSGLLILWLFPWMTINLLVLNLALSLYILIGARIEERKLRTEFGQEYEDYMMVTPMFVPFLKRNNSRRGTS